MNLTDDILASEGKANGDLERIAEVLKDEGGVEVILSEERYNHPQAPKPRLTTGVIYYATFISEANTQCRVELGRSAVDAKTGKVHGVGEAGMTQAVAYLSRILAILWRREMIQVVNLAPSLNRAKFGDYTKQFSLFPYH